MIKNKRFRIIGVIVISLALLIAGVYVIRRSIHEDKTYLGGLVPITGGEKQFRCGDPECHIYSFSRCIC